jgi:hypothetical protein
LGKAALIEEVWSKEPGIEPTRKGRTVLNIRYIYKNNRDRWGATGGMDAGRTGTTYWCTNEYSISTATGLSLEHKSYPRKQQGDFTVPARATICFRNVRRDTDFRFCKQQQPKIVDLSAEVIWKMRTLI